MATKYINPTFANNGDGTARTAAASPGAAGAYNAVPSISSNTTYLFEGGTTTTISAEIAAASGTVFGSIGNGRAILNASASAASIFRLAGAGIEIKDLHLITSTTNGKHGIYSASTGSSEVNIHDCMFEGPSSTSGNNYGITFAGLDAGPIQIWKNDFDGFQYSILLTPDTVTGGALVHDNTSTSNIGPSSGDEEKFLHTGGATLDWAGTLHVYDNTISGYGEYGIDLVGAANARVYNNTFGAPSGRWATDSCICCGGTGTGGYAWVYNNIMLNAIYGGITIRGSTNNKIWGNLIKAAVPIIAGTTGADACTIFNNTLISTGSTAFQLEVGTHTLTQNVMSGRVNSTAGAATLLRNKMTAAVTGAATITDNGDNDVGPLYLAGDYSPTSSSPAYGTGKHVMLGITDAYGRPFNHATPSIGAVEALPK